MAFFISLACVCERERDMEGGRENRNTENPGHLIDTIFCSLYAGQGFAGTK